MSQTKYNIVIIGVSYFDGMASSTRVRNLLEPLLKENSITVSNLIYEKEAKGITLHKGTIHKIKYFIIGYKITNILSLVQFLWRGIKFLRSSKSNSKKNIIYNYQYPDIKNIIFLLYARFIGYKIILDIVEDNRYYTKFHSKLNRFKIISSIFFLKLLPFIAHTVLAISDHLYNLMLPLCKGKVPVYLIPITVDLSRFEKKPYCVPNNFKIFYGGSFGEKDGLEYLIKAFDEVCLKFGNVELILTGRASDADYEKLHHYIENSPSKDKILFKGFLETDDYYEVLNQCDIFCMTRVNSKFANAGFPFKLGEFLSSSKAVIATNVGDIPKYLTNHKNALIVNPGSVEELVKSLCYILENPEKISSLGQQARKVAELNFDTKILSKEILEIFKKI